MLTDKFKQSMSKQVYLELREQILNNTLKPGDRLVEISIAAEQKVSRTPVREALRQLEQENLVSTFPRKGSIVSKISVSSSLEHAKVCTALEALSLHLMIAEGNQKSMEQMEHQLELMEDFCQKNDLEGFINAYRKWQTIIANGSSNTPLKQLLMDSYQYLHRLVPLMFASEGRLYDAKEELRAIYDAVQREDEPLIVANVRHHLQQCWENVYQNVDFRNFKR